MEYKKYNTDLIAAILMFAVFLLFFFRMGNISDNLDLMFPLFVLYSVLLLTVFLFVKAYFSPEKKEIFNEALIKNVWIGVACCFAWVIILDNIGYITAGVSMLMLITTILDKQRKNTFRYFITNAITNILIVTVTYLIFSKFLEVPLPVAIF